MRRALSPTVPALAVATAWLFACLIFHSYYYNFDGVACAVAVELGDWRFLLHGNHLLYGGLGRLAYLAATSFAPGLRALIVLDLLNAVLAAASLALFFRLLLRLGVPEKTALASTAGLAFSFAFWFYSLEAQVYPLGLLLVLGAASAALKEEPSPGRVGLWHGLAIAGHVTHVCLAPALLYRVWTAGRGGPRSAARYAAAAAATLGALYGTAWMIMTAEGGRGALGWLMGTAAPAFGRGFHWHGSFEPHVWLSGVVTAVWAQKGSLAWHVHPGPLFWPEAAALGLFVWAWTRLDRRLATFFGLWLAGYAAFFSTWEPFNPNYHLADLAALWLVPALAVTARPGRKHRLIELAALLVAVNNLVYGIAPLTSPDVNPRLAEMRFVQENVPTEGWVATLEGDAMVYVPYFASRKPWTLPRRAEPPPAGAEVYALAEVIDSPEWRAYLSRNWDWQETRQGGLRLYKLRRLEPPVKAPTAPAQARRASRPSPPDAR